MAKTLGLAMLAFIVVLTFTETGYATPVSGVCTCDQSPCTLVPLKAGERFDLTDVAVMGFSGASAIVALSAGGIPKAFYTPGNSNVSTQAYVTPIRFADAPVVATCSFSNPGDVVSITVSGLKR